MKTFTHTHKKRKSESAKGERNSQWKGGRRSYRTISGALKHELVHHLDENRENNNPDNLIPIPAYIPNFKNVTLLSDLPRSVTSSLHEKIHRKASKKESNLLSREEIIETVEEIYPEYYSLMRPKFENEYERLSIREKLLY